MAVGDVGVLVRVQGLHWDRSARSALHGLVGGGALGAGYGALVLAGATLISGLGDGAGWYALLVLPVGLVYGGLFGALLGAPIGLLAGLVGGLALSLMASDTFAPQRVAGVAGAGAGVLVGGPAFTWAFLTSPGTLTNFTPVFAVNIVLFVAVPTLITAAGSGWTGQRVVQRQTGQ